MTPVAPEITGVTQSIGITTTMGMPEHVDTDLGQRIEGMVSYTDRQANSIEPLRGSGVKESEEDVPKSELLWLRP